MKVTAQNTGDKSIDKRAKRAEKMAVSEKLTNGFMLTLTYGIIGIILLEIARRNYASWDIDFASGYCIAFGVLFAVLVAGTLILGALKKIPWKKAGGYTILFVVSSLVSFFLSYDMRLPISRSLFANDVNIGMIDFLKNLDLARDVKLVEYGVGIFIAVAFVIYAIRLALLEKNAKQK